MPGKRRYIILFLIYKNLQIKYKHSALGFLWSLLQPFLYLLIFLMIFSNAFPSIDNYPLYVLSGLVFWIFFSGTTGQLCLIYNKNIHLIKSLSIPNYIYPLTDMGSELISFILGLVPFMIIMFFMGLNFSLNLLYLIPVILLFSVFVFSVGLILGCLNVYFRDVGILWFTISPAIFFLSPIAYVYSIVPDNFKLVMKFNPIYHFLVIVRDTLYYQHAPTPFYMLTCFIITVAFALIALLIYRKTRYGFISNL